MIYAIFLIVTAVCAYGLHYLTNKILTGSGLTIKSGATEGMSLRCIISFIFLLVTLFLPIKSPVIHLGVEFAALVNLIASVTQYTIANFKARRRLKKQRKEEKLSQKR